MATINPNNTVLDLNQMAEIDFESASQGDSIRFNYQPVGDEKLVILAKGTGTLTIKKGDSIQGVTDVVAEVTAEGAMRIDSGMFKNVDGTDADGAVNENKGFVIVEVTSASSAIDVALIQLP